MATPSPNNMLKSPPTLPLDVLCEIFKFYIEDYYHTRPFSPLRTPRDIPWFLSHLCRHWRTAAIATPQLWKRFPPLKSTAQSVSLSDNPMFDELLTRSEAHPIHVQFDFAQGTKGNSDTKPNPALVPLLAASRRWEEVTIHCPVGDTVHFREIEGRIPCLRRAEVFLVGGVWPDEVRIDPKLRPMNILSDAPMLSELLLNNSLPFTVPWGQMIKLQLSYPRDIYEILKCAEDLDTLMLLDCRSSDSKNRPSLKHAKLRKFYFHVQGSKWGCSFAVDELELPALETFVLTVDPTWPCEGQNMMDDLRSLFIRSGCNLQHLVFYGAALEDNRVLDLLKATPDLRTLELGNCANLDEVLLWLVFEETDTTLLPYLHTLTLSFHPYIDHRHTMIIRRIVESRAQVVEEGSEDFPGLLFSPLQNVAIRVKLSYIRFQVCLDLNGGTGAPGDPLPEAGMSYPIWPFDGVVEFEHISEFTRNRGDFERNITALNERQLADILRFQHTYERACSRNSLRKVCQSLVTRTEDFIKNYKWMLVGEQDIIYIHPEHELRNTPNCWDIAFGMVDGGSGSLGGYRDSELLAGPRKWWTC